MAIRSIAGLVYLIMLSLKVMLVEDEARVRNSIRNLLEMYVPAVEIIGESESVAQAERMIAEFKPDLVLLDIKLTDGSGFDLLRKFDPLPFKFIFVTAYDKYAIDAFKFSAIDYLLKPLNPDELLAAITRARQSAVKADLEVKISTFLNNISRLNNAPKRIVLKTHDTVHVVELNNVIRCVADRNYTRFHLEGEKTILVTGTLKEYEDMLTHNGFFRAHHSHLVNLGFVDHFKKNKLMLVMKDYAEVPVATRKKEILMGVLDKI